MTKAQSPSPKTPPDSGALGGYLRAQRTAARLSIRNLAERVGVSYGYLSRLESGQYLRPSPDILYRLAEVLEIDGNDLLARTGYAVSSDLPSFTPYLRAKYNMSDEAAKQLSDHFQQMTDVHHITERPSSPRGRRKQAH
jgi:transcriptional regulator with XRE-family HTH domain